MKQIIFNLFLYGITVLSADLSSILEPISFYPKNESILLTHNTNTPTLNNTEQKINPLESKTKPNDSSFILTYVDIIKQLISELVDKYGLEGEIKITPLKSIPDIKLDNADYQIVFTEIPRNTLRPTFTIAFKVMDSKGIEVGHYSVPVKCELFQEVYTTTGRLDKGMNLSDVSLKIKYMDVLRMTDTPVLRDINLNEYEINHTLQSDKIVTWQHIAPKPLIRKGKTIEIIAEDGLMKIVTKGVALENGLSNDLITVRNIHSKKDIQARVINENLVKVSF